VRAQATSDASNAYGFGVSMGFASFQAGDSKKDWYLVYNALVQARKFADLLKAIAPGLNAAPLSEMGAQLKSSKTTEQELAPRIVTALGEFQQILLQVSKPLGNAYLLGVAISIAEAQATAGEQARGIVRSSLINAQSPATNLGVPTTEINGIIAQIDQGVGLISIYGQIGNLRGKYQSLLSAITHVVNNGPKISTKSPSVSPDSVLLKLECTRPAVDEYKCPTQRAYETCQSYLQKGSVKVCTTTVNVLVQASIDKMLFSVGCTRFLGRADEFMCKTQRGLDLCETYHKNGKLKKCVMVK
jgi:hypothetical protein